MLIKKEKKERTELLCTGARRQRRISADKRILRQALCLKKEVSGACIYSKATRDSLSKREPGFKPRITSNAMQSDSDGFALKGGGGEYRTVIIAQRLDRLFVTRPFYFAKNNDFAPQTFARGVQPSSNFSRKHSFIVSVGIVHVTKTESA